jgi:hypothetical protein
MEWTQGGVIELIELYKRKEIIWDPKHPIYFNKRSDYNLILNFFHKPQTLISVLPVCNPSNFQQELHNFRHVATDCLLGNSEEVLQANVRITTCQET